MSLTSTLDRSVRPNVFSDQPMFLWLVIAFVQTCVIIPLLIYRFGKGAYCGWICSCGAMATAGMELIRITK